MSEKIFSTFFQEAGFKIYSSSSSDWCEIQRGMLMSIPYHRLISPTANELDDLLERSGAFGVRYPTEQNNYGFNSYLTFCRTSGYSMNDVKSKSRNQVRKGEQCCEVREISFSELVEAGLSLNLKTCERQRRTDPKADQAYWQRLCKAGESTQGAFALGAYYQKQLAAYLIILETPTVAEIIIQNSDSELLKYCPNNLLTYVATRRYLAEKKTIIAVCYGLGSLEETSSLDHFKIGMGYELEPIKQRLYFTKKIRWILKPIVLSMGEWLQRTIFKKNYLLRKCCGILKNYLSQGV